MIALARLCTGGANRSLTLAALYEVNPRRS